MSSVELLLIFMTGETRIPDAPRWSWSLRIKNSALDVLQARFLEQLPKVAKELDEIELSGELREAKEYTELIVLYEAFLNSVYSLFENISEFVRFMYRNKNLPRGFSEQKKRFHKDEEIDRDYAKLLETTKWYDQINPMRDEAIHFLSGLITIGDTGELKYFNVPKSCRASTPERILIDNIEEHVKKTYFKAKEFLKLFADHFLKIINQDSRIILPCISSSNKPIGSRLISLKEYLRGEPAGICRGSDNCPERAICQAKKS